MRKILSPDFYNRDTEKVARELLGKYLVIKTDSKTSAYMIKEVEVYDGLEDLASHASQKRSERNSVMFKTSGRWYVYLVYGIHYMLNIVTREEEYPAGILIRGIEGAIGPGSVTKKLRINKSFNDKIADKKTGLWIEDRGVKISLKQIKKSPRIGVKYAGEIWANKSLRYFI